MEGGEATGASVNRPKSLVVRFSAIGDCVMAVPVAAAIRERYPEGFLVWAVESRCAAVVDSQRLVDRCVTFPRDKWKKARWSAQTWREQIQKYLSLRKLHFDYGVDLQGHSKTALCLRLAKPKQRVSIGATDTFARMLNPCLPEMTEIHAVERNLKALAMLGDFPLNPHFIMPELDAERDRVREQLPAAGPLVTIASSAGHPSKAYPIDRWAVVAESLQNQGFTVAFLGGPGDPKPPVEGAVDLVGKLSLAQSMAAVALSRVHLASDTGTGHIAAAYGVPVVSIFGATDPVRFRPYTDKLRLLVGEGTPGTVDPKRVASAATELLEWDGQAVPG